MPDARGLAAFVPAKRNEFRAADHGCHGSRGATKCARTLHFTREEDPRLIAKSRGSFCNGARSRERGSSEFARRGRFKVASQKMRRPPLRVTNLTELVSPLRQKAGRDPGACHNGDAGHSLNERTSPCVELAITEPPLSFMRRVKTSARRGRRPARRGSTSQRRGSNSRRPGRTSRTETFWAA